MNIKEVLHQLESEGNYRFLPDDFSKGRYIDFSSNDYLGIGNDVNLRKRFLEDLKEDLPPFSSSASRLLAASQEGHKQLEEELGVAYKNNVLLFNSGYHANTGTISAMASTGRPLILADRLAHASIIDGIILSRAPFLRFPHNDTNALERLIIKNRDRHDRIIVITESIFSMDGDAAPLNDFIELKKKYQQVVLYLDEAHAFGVLGPGGLGLAASLPESELWDIIIGTFGKAAASAGAFVSTSKDIKEFLVNKARSLIFSTALPPFQSMWTRFVFRRILTMEKERAHLQVLGEKLNEVIRKYAGEPYIPKASHIQPLVTCDAKLAVSISKELDCRGIKALPIRRPTVPPGTERIRFSLSASMTEDNIKMLDRALIESDAANIRKI